MSAAEAVESALPALAFTSFQERALAVPEEYDLFLGGGRGGGKSWTMCIAYLRHAETYGRRAKMLYVRQSFPGVTDFEETCREVFGLVYGPAARYNASAHLWRFPNGATLQLEQIEGPADFSKFQGKSFTLIGADEAQHWASPQALDLLRSCLRARTGIRCRFMMAANPGGAGHHWLVKRHINAGQPWRPYVVTAGKHNRTWVNAPSVFRENPHLDAEEYAAELAAACATDPELLKAWEHGDWNIARGAFFSAVIDQARVMTEPWPVDFNASTRADAWELFLSYDHGSSAPAVCYVVGRSPGATGRDGRFYPRGSLVLIDEMATNEPNSLDRGMGYTVPRVADEIKALAMRWGIRPEGCADDACFSQHGSASGSIADEFRKEGVYFVPARKADRKTGWERMKTLLQAAGQPDKPGLYVSRLCEYWWQTVPVLPRDPRKPDDVDSRSPDHAADTSRYATMFERVHLEVKSISGFW